MSEPVRPGGTDVPGLGLRPVPGRIGRRRGRSALVPLGDLARRLASLERQVETALTGGPTTASALPGLDATVDRLLGGYVFLRRWLLDDLARLPAAGEVAEAILLGLYRYWWRVETRGLERIPAHGPVLLMTNRSGSLVPYEAFVVAMALAADHPQRRGGRPLLDEGLLKLPVVGAMLASIGAASGTRAQARRLIDAGEAVVAFPEAPQTDPKPARRRYRIGRFGRSSLFRLAIERGVPIVPVAVIGSEETQPVLYRVGLARALGLPAMPVTPTFPWLGIAGLLPLPTKWTLYVGDSLDVAARYRPAAADDAVMTRGLREHLRERLQGLVSEGLRRRRSVFFG